MIDKVNQWPQKTSRFLKEVRFEMERVTWPGREEVRKATVVVIVFTLLAGLAFGVVDMAFNGIISWFIG